MRGIREKKGVFLAAIIVSVSFHSILIGAVAGTNFFEFLRPLNSRTFLASLVSEKAYLPSGKAQNRPAHVKTGDVEAPPDNEAGMLVPDGMGDKARLRDGGGESEGVSEKSTPAEYSTHASAGKGDKEDHNEGGTEAAAANNIKGDILQNGTPNDIALPLRHLRESFHYDIYWLGIYVGNAVLESSNDNGVLRITSEAHSAPVISAFYMVEDYAESRLVDGLPFNFRIRQHEGKYRSDKETQFDPANKKILFSNYLSATRDEHTVDTMRWDVISGFYYLRNQFLEVGRTVYVDVFDSNKFLKVAVNVLRKERVSVAATGETDAIVVRLLLQSEGLFQSRGDILIWLTDDDRRIPLRVETKAPIGYVSAELKILESE